MGREAQWVKGHKINVSFLSGKPRPVGGSFNVFGVPKGG